MAYKFDDGDKEVREFKESLPFGVSLVKFLGAIADETDSGKDFVEVGLVTESGIESSARVWFVGGAVNISWNTLRDIAVHNGKDEEEKQKIRDRVDAAVDTDALVEVLNEVCQGGEFWVRKEYDPTRKYEDKDGNTRRSINTNIYGYQPKERPEFMPSKADEQGEPIDENVAKAFPGATKVNEGIPKKDGWA